MSAMSMLKQSNTVKKLETLDDRAHESKLTVDQQSYFSDVRKSLPWQSNADISIQLQDQKDDQDDQMKSPTVKVRQDAEERDAKVVYEPMDREVAQQMVNYSMRFFNRQCDDDSDHEDGNYIFELKQCPKNVDEAEAMKVELQDDVEYGEEVQEYIEEEETDDQDSPHNQTGHSRSIKTSDLLLKDVESNLSMLPQEQRNALQQKYELMERTSSELLRNKTPSEVAQQVLKDSNIDMNLI